MICIKKDGSINSSSPFLEEVYTSMIKTPVLGKRIQVLLETFVFPNTDLIVMMDTRSYVIKKKSIIHLSTFKNYLTISKDVTAPTQAKICSLAHELYHVIDDAINEFGKAPHWKFNEYGFEPQFDNTKECRAICGVKGLYQGENAWRKHFNLQERINHRGSESYIPISEDAKAINRFIYLIGSPEVEINTVLEFIDSNQLDLHSLSDEQLLHAVIPNQNSKTKMNSEVIDLFMNEVVKRKNTTLIWHFLHLLSATGSHHLVKPARLSEAGISFQTLMDFNIEYLGDEGIDNIPDYLYQ